MRLKLQRLVHFMKLKVLLVSGNGHKSVTGNNENGQVDIIITGRYGKGRESSRCKGARYQKPFFVNALSLIANTNMARKQVK